jgi:hypothetical protein
MHGHGAATFGLRDDTPRGRESLFEFRTLVGKYAESRNLNDHDE